MKRWYITFSGRAYDEQTRKLLENAPRLGADDVLVYDDKWLETTELYAENQWLWCQKGDRHGLKRGFGWFVWKPYILMHCLEHFMSEGDVVLFTDGDTYPIADLGPLYQHAAGAGAMFFKAQGCNNRQWVKRDCWIVTGLSEMLHQPGMPAAVPLDSQHATARFILIRKGPWRPRQLLMQWLTYCLNPFATTFDPSVIGGRELGFNQAPEAEGFQEHRTEQAILSLLIHAHGYRMHREACQFGNAALEQFGEDSWYPQTFVQEWGSGPRDGVGPGSAFRNVEVRLASL